MFKNEMNNEQCKVQKSKINLNLSFKKETVFYSLFSIFPSLNAVAIMIPYTYIVYLFFAEGT